MKDKAGDPIRNIDLQINEVLDVWQANKMEKPVEKEIYLNMIEQIAKLFSIGSFYYFILNFENYMLDFVSESITAVIGIKLRPLVIQDLLQLMHPEDLEKMSTKEDRVVDFFLNRISKQDIPYYKAVYVMRIKHSDGHYKTILHQSKAIVVSDDGKVQKSLCIHTDISYLNIAIDHRVSLIGDQRPSYYFEEGDGVAKPLAQNPTQIFTDREIEILYKISEGKSFNQIANELYISPHTVNTHKKNILVKAECKNTAELMAKCIREGII